MMQPIVLDAKTTREQATPQTAGAMFVELATTCLDTEARAYLLTAAGLQPLAS